MNNFVEDLTLKSYFANVEKLPLSLGIKKKDLGAYYTDIHVVKYILENLDIDRNSYILDPSCGCGSFIFPLYFQSLTGIPNDLGQIYGIDIDKRAIDFTVNAISNLSGCPDKGEILNHFINDDFIFESANKHRNSTEFSKIIESGGFHFIIGNPPFNLNIQNKKLPTFMNSTHREIAKKSKNIPINFILKGLEILRKDGILAFVLPKTLLYVGRYKEFRSYLMENFTVLKIVEIGIKFKDVRGEQIILFVKNKKPRKNSSIEFSTISREPPYQSENSFKVKQTYFNLTKTLPTMPNNESYLLVNELINRKEKLLDASEIAVFRGISLGKTDLKKIPYIKNSNLPDNAFIRGKDISKLTLKNLTITNDSSIKISPLSELKKPKIVTQNIYSSESGLISYFDMQGIPTAETVSNIVIENQDKLAYVYALLNSKLMNFFLSQYVFSGSKLTMHVDGYYLRQLPLIWDTKREETSSLINLAMNIDKDTRNYKSILDEIDKIVYKLYGVTEDQRNVIEMVMNKTLSRKSIW
ncbi:MAG: N-6 DNA methylase [Candidatus Parvarchaeum sp.]|nr:N-6 DNA methylase [Candidatus Parvarchaeum tengchongense]